MRFRQFLFSRDLMTKQQVEPKVGIEEIRTLQQNIVSSFKSLVSDGDGRTGRDSEAFGRLAKLYQLFHLATDDMFPGRAIDFTETVDRIGDLLCNVHREAFLRGFHETDGEIAPEAIVIAAMPYLSSLTTARMERAPYTHEAAVFHCFPANR